MFYEPLSCSSLDLTWATAGCTGDLVHLLKCSYLIQAFVSMTRTILDNFLRLITTGQLFIYFFSLLFHYFSLCSRCLIKDFEARPSVTHLLEHPFIKQAHGKDAALRKRLSALVQEQQNTGTKPRTRTKYVFFSSDITQKR